MFLNENAIFFFFLCHMKSYCMYESLPNNRPFLFSVSNQIKDFAVFKKNIYSYTMEVGIILCNCEHEDNVLLV